MLIHHGLLGLGFRDLSLLAGVEPGLSLWGPGAGRVACMLSHRSCLGRKELPV